MGVLKDTKVLLTGLSAADRQSCISQVQALGGKLATVILAHQLPHVVVTSRWSSEKVKAVLRFNDQVPVVHPRWLAKCSETNTLVPYDAEGCALPVFAGCKISISGHADKADLEALVRRHGGAYSADLDKSCTHLVAENSQSRKYMAARTWHRETGIHTVCADWIRDSVEAGRALDPMEYPVGGGGAGPSAAALAPSAVPTPPAQHQQQVVALSSMQLPSVSSSGGRAGPSIARQHSTASLARHPSSRSASVPPRLPPPAPSQHPLQQQQQQPEASTSGWKGEAVPPPPPPAASAGQRRQAGGGNGSCGGAAAAHRGRAVYAGPGPGSDGGMDGLFLDGARVWLAGCEGAQRQQLIGVLRAGAATRHARLDPPVTHIVVGRALTRDEAAASREHATQHLHTRVVSADWLLQCGALQQLVDESAYVLPLPSLATRAQQAAAAAQQAAAAAATSCGGGSTSGGGALQRSSSGGLPRLGSVQQLQAGAGGGAAAPGDAGGGYLDSVMDATMVGAPGCVEAGPAAGDAALPGVFEGLFFTLAALRGKAGEAEAARLVQDHGGRLFDTRTMGIAIRPLAVCPPALTSQEVARLAKGPATRDFGMVSRENHVTTYWLQCCVDRRELLPFPHSEEGQREDERGLLLFRPLPYNLPLNKFDSLRLCCSGYGDGRAGLCKLAVLLGARWSDAFSKQCTHLMIPTADGRKWEAAVKWRVPCVTADWLVECARQGRRVREADYLPRQPRGGARGSQRAVASTGLQQQQQYSTQQLYMGATQGGSLVELAATQVPVAPPRPGSLRARYEALRSSADATTTSSQVQAAAPSAAPASGGTCPVPAQMPLPQHGGSNTAAAAASVAAAAATSAALPAAAGSSGGGAGMFGGVQSLLSSMVDSESMTGMPQPPQQQPDGPTSAAAAAATTRTSAAAAAAGPSVAAAAGRGSVGHCLLEALLQGPLPGQTERQQQQPPQQARQRLQPPGPPPETSASARPPAGARSSAAATRSVASGTSAPGTRVPAASADGGGSVGDDGAVGDAGGAAGLDVFRRLEGMMMGRNTVAADADGMHMQLSQVDDVPAMSGGGAGGGLRGRVAAASGAEVSGGSSAASGRKRRQQDRDGGEVSGGGGARMRTRGTRVLRQATADLAADACLLGSQLDMSQQIGYGDAFDADATAAADASAGGSTAAPSAANVVAAAGIRPAGRRSSARQQHNENSAPGGAGSGGNAAALKRRLQRAAQAGAGARAPKPDKLKELGLV